jgi:hypothetical protein
VGVFGDGVLVDGVEDLDGWVGSCWCGSGCGCGLESEGLLSDISDGGEDSMVFGVGDDDGGWGMAIGICVVDFSMWLVRNG